MGSRLIDDGFVVGFVCLFVFFRCCCFFFFCKHIKQFVQARCKLKKCSHCNLMGTALAPGSGLSHHTQPWQPEPMMQSRAHITRKWLLFP